MADERSKNTSRYWNQDVVSTACVTLMEMNITPTVRTVRSHLDISRGSDSTVQKFIRVFHESTDVAIETETPKPLLTAFESLWQQALSMAAAQYQTDRAKLDDDKKRVTEERKAIEQLLIAKDDEYQETLRKRDLIIEKLTDSNENLEQQAAELHQVINDQSDLISQNADTLHAKEREVGIAKEDIQQGINVQSALKEQVDKLNDLIAHLSAENKEKERVVSAQKLELEERERALNKAITKSTSDDSNINSLKQKIDDLGGKANSLQELNTILTNEVKTLKEEVRQGKSSLESSLSQIDQMNRLVIKSQESQERLFEGKKSLIITIVKGQVSEQILEEIQNV